MNSKLESDQSDEFRCGIVSVVGRPNVGKSTLVNALINKELSITSVHPHTTRNQIRAIDTGKNYQIIYVDTPGIHKPRNLMSEKMNEYAYEAFDGVDVIIGVFDASGSIGTGDTFVAERLVDQKNVFLVLNKCDVEKNFERVAERAKQVSDLVPNAKHVFITSAFTKKNIQLIKKAIKEQLQVGPALFDEDTQIDMSDSKLVSELYREALIRLLRDEIPQSLAVIAQEQEPQGNKRVFEIKIIVTRNSHKGIVIGKGGSMLESAGSQARSKAEVLLGSQIVMKSHVEVDQMWQSKSENLDSYFS